MCRQIAICNGVGRDEALEIALRMEGGNTMGIGCGWVDDQQKFQIQKYPISLSKALKRGVKFLNHLPHAGFTLLHMRLPSMGQVSLSNTHPFNINNKYLFCHNGCYGNFSNNRMLRKVMEKYQDFEGETDTEIAARLMELIGFKEFLSESNNDGCFFGLHRNGTLNVVKSSGDLQISPFSKVGEATTYLLSSELDKEKYPERMNGVQGWYKFNKDGTFKSYKKKEYQIVSQFQGKIINSPKTIDLEETEPPMEIAREWTTSYHGGNDDWRYGTRPAGSQLPSIYRPPKYGGNNTPLTKEEIEQLTGWES